MNMSEWQPIDTAPRIPIDKFGYGPTIFLLIEGSPGMGFWDQDFDRWYIETEAGHHPQPSHWLAVPSLPIG